MTLSKKHPTYKYRTFFTKEKRLKQFINVLPSTSWIPDNDKTVFTFVFIINIFFLVLIHPRGV